MKRRITGMTVALLLLATAGWTGEMKLVAKPLEPGDTAPPVKAFWIQGEGMDPAAATGQHIYVVEFWATWCGPCRQTIPHINKLYQQYKDQGVVFMGLSKEDQATITGFLQEVPMRYNVGFDKGGLTQSAYMAGVDGIPFAVVVGKDGKVAWTGHPMDGMDRVIKDLVAGTFDMSRQETIAQLKDKLRQTIGLIQAGQATPQQLLAVVDKLIAADKENPEFYNLKTDLLGKLNMSQQIPALYRLWAENCAESPRGLAQLALAAAGNQSIDQRAPRIALAAAQKAEALNTEQDMETAFAIANAYFMLSQPAKAAGILETMLAAEVNQGAPERATLQKYADYYKTLAGLTLDNGAAPKPEAEGGPKPEGEAVPEGEAMPE